MKQKLISMLMVVVISIGTMTTQVFAAEKVTELAAPVIKVAAVSESKLKISWEAIENAEQYYVYRRNAEGKYTRIATTKKTAVTNGKLNASTKYFYKVVAIRGSGEELVKSSASKAASGTTKSATKTETTLTETTEKSTTHNGRTVVKTVADALSNGNESINYITQAAIKSTKNVYIASSGGGTKYHRLSDCSKMLGTIECTVEEAQKSVNPKGVTYTSCKKTGC